MKAKYRDTYDDDENDQTEKDQGQLQIPWRAAADPGGIGREREESGNERDAGTI